MAEDTIFKDSLDFIHNYDEVYWPELQTKLAAQLRVCRTKLGASQLEIAQQVKLSLEELEQAENGSKETSMLTYLKLYLFYHSQIKADPLTSPIDSEMKSPVKNKKKPLL